MRFILFLFFIIASSLTARGFDNNFNIGNDSIQINLDSVVIISDNNDSIVEKLFTIKNNTGDKIWIWLDNDTSNKDEILIKNFFFKREDDFSIYDIATDPNMTVDWWLTPMELTSFVKCLQSHENFTIVFSTFSKKNLDVHKIKDMVKIFPGRIISKYCPDLNNKATLDRISYPYNAIMLPYDIKHLTFRK